MLGQMKSQAARNLIDFSRLPADMFRDSHFHFHALAGLGDLDVHAVLAFSPSSGSESEAFKPIIYPAHARLNCYGECNSNPGLVIGEGLDGKAGIDDHSVERTLPESDRIVPEFSARVYGVGSYSNG